MEGLSDVPKALDIKYDLIGGAKSEERVLDALKALDIEFELFRHDALPDGKSVVATFASRAELLPLINLFCYDKKKNFYVISGYADATLNLKAVQTALKAPSPRFANAEQMQELLGVEPGSVTPFAAMNDTQNKVNFVMDASLQGEARRVLVHPLHNQATVALRVTDLMKFMEANGHPIQWVDFSVNCSKTGVEKTKIPDAVTERPTPTQWKSPPENSAPAAAPTSGVAGTEQLGITVKKAENFAEWYTQVITRSEMVEYYDVSGCYILRPWSFFMWESVQEYMNKRIKKHGVQNSYFPMFVSQSKLEAEKDHVEGFSPEVAWVTRYGDSTLAEPIALRPTSETIMYPAFAKWIRSHRDLPLLLNQWCQVVRWEFKQPTPFIRTREFLWQEGHTAHATDTEAMDFVLKALEIYRCTYEDLLAVPVVKGRKSELEKFAGAKMTTTVETLIAANGRAVQAATSHHLGQNFSKMFNIQYETGDSRDYVHQTSWGFTTRSLGIAIMVHGDDKGMVMPPRVAPVQVVCIPIVYKEGGDDLKSECRRIVENLNNADIRTKLDDRDNYKPGWKYNHWECRGVCLRMEVGPRDFEQRTVRLVRRDNGEKIDVSWDGLEATVSNLLNTIHEDMLSRARATLTQRIVKVERFDEVMSVLNARNLLLSPWCQEIECEEKVKEETGRLSVEAAAADDGTAMTGAMKTLCTPFEQPALPEGTKCLACERQAKGWTLWGRSY